MIPLKDDVPSRTFPIVNLSLITINVLFFILELGLGERLEGFLYQAAVVPVLFTGRDHSLGVVRLLLDSVSPDLGARVLLSLFLHGGWAHLLGNMLYLWIFGDNVEDRMGHFRYLVFYLLCGWVATFTHVWAEPASRMPSIGASGAIAGVLGAYVSLYPRARVVTLIPLGFFFPLVQVPAVFFLGFWFLQQFLAGTLSLAARTAETGGVAWWAHVGGFAAGFGLVALFQRPQRRPPARDDWWDDWEARHGRFRV
ncbi:MAG: rhomboid family intramembrane serine protease [Vicinamibacteria bacterium]